MPDWLTARPIAHRGLHDAAGGVIENTVSAFRAAIDGRYAIECDLQLAADGEAMVYHDAELGRLTEGSARVDSLSAGELRAVAFKATGDRMITLGELCDLVGGRVPLVIELKSRFDGDLRLAARTARVIEAYAGEAALMSFDPGPVTALRDLAPKRPRGLVAMRRQRGAAEPEAHPARFVVQAIAARLDYLAYRVQDLPSALPSAARRFLGMPLLTWTVRTQEDRAAAARHADQIIFEGFRP